MTERPILFSAPMVLAILDGRKTQTRRIVKPQPPAHASDIEESEGYPGEWFYWLSPDDRSTSFFCPYGIPADRLWVREGWRYSRTADGRETIEYRADGGNDPTPNAPELRRWRSAIHLRRARARITLEVVDVRVERVEDISEADAHAEGIFLPSSHGMYVADPRSPLERGGRTAREGYLSLFYQINAKTPPGSNPWVWVIEFRRVP